MPIKLICLLGLWCLTISQEWMLVFEDTFDGTSLNESIWTPIRHNSHEYPYELQLYQTKNVYLENGYLMIKTEYNPTYDPNTN